jgi:hypothetical protein
MSIYFQIGFLIFLIYISYKSGFLMMFNYIIGLLLTLFFTSLHFQSGFRTKADVPIYIFNLFLYTFLFITSIFIYFDKENSRGRYYPIPIISYCAIIFIETETLKIQDAFSSMFLPIFLAFFPLFFLKYYIKYIKLE